MRALLRTMAVKRSSARSLLRFAFASAVFIAFLGFVELMRAWGLFPISIASPSEIYKTLVAHYDDPSFHLKPTLWATIVGYFFACTAAMALAMLAVLVKRSESIVYNFAVVIYSIPLIASAPILVMWFGVGSTVRIIIAAVAGFFPVLVGAIQGLRAVDRQAAELFHCLSATKFQEFRLLALPSALPYLFAGLKISAASALLGAIISEWVGAEKGLGLMMAYALFSFNVALVWLTLIVSIISAILAYSLVGLVEKRVVYWERPAEMVAE